GLLHEAWLNKKQMNPEVATPYLDELYGAARDAGAIGGKLLGAGRGGVFLFYTPFMKQGRVTEALVAHGAQPAPFVLDHHGMQTWEVLDQNLHEETGGLFGSAA